MRTPQIEAPVHIVDGPAPARRSSELFRMLASRVAAAVGSAGAFLAALLVIVAWAVTGPMFHFSDTWQLVINTGTTIVTFLMVFLIQNTQNRDARAIHLKLDELIRASRGARNQLIDLEALSDEELDHLHKEFQDLCARDDCAGAQTLLRKVEAHGRARGAERQRRKQERRDRA